MFVLVFVFLLMCIYAYSEEGYSRGAGYEYSKLRIASHTVQIRLRLLYQKFARSYLYITILLYYISS